MTTKPPSRLVSRASVGESTTDALLRIVISELRGLRRDLAGQRPLSLTRADRVVIGNLLPAIGGTFGSELFIVRELFEHESAALHLLLHDVNAKQLGRLFRRAEGQPVGGYVIERGGEELHCVLWRVVQ